MTAIVTGLNTYLRRLAFAVLACLIPLTASLAAPFTADGITFDIPAGFDGPQSGSMSERHSYAFTRQSTSSSVKTLLQITVYDSGGAIPPNLKKEELAQGSEKYVLDFLKGVERRRTSFVQGNVVHLMLNGIPASKIAWKGDMQGVPANGIMYAFIVGAKVFSLHTQDSGNEPSAGMLEASKSFETLKGAR